MKMINISIRTVNKVEFFKFSNLIWSDIFYTFYPRRLVWYMACMPYYGIKKDSLIVVVNL